MTDTGVDPTYVGAGTGVHADNAAVSPGLPSGIAVGDLILVFAGCRTTTATMTITDGWEVLADLDTHIRLYGRIWDGVFGAPTVTPAGGAAGNSVSAQSAAFRDGALDVDRLVVRIHTATAQHITCPPLTPSRGDCIVLRLGWRQDDWTSVAAMTGGTLIDDPSTTLGSDQGLVWDHQIQDDRARVAGGSFIVTGGSAALTVGATISIPPASLVAATVTMSGRTWMPTRIRTDWAGDGFDGDHTIDDLGHQAGEWSVKHHLDDGLPDEVSFASGLGVGVLGADLTGRGPLPTPVSVVSDWSDSGANASAATARTVTVTVPAGLTVGDRLIIGLAVNSSTPTFDTPPDDLNVLFGPTVDGAALNTITYTRIVDAALAADGAAYVLDWSADSLYSWIAATIGGRDGSGRNVRATFVAADQTNETGSGVTTHDTPTVAGAAPYNAVVTLWARGTTTLATWTLPDTEIAEVVGNSGSSDNIDLALGVGAVPSDGGDHTRTATTSSTSNATMGIAVFALTSMDEGMSARAYWSPLRTDSPVVGYSRDIAPLTLDVGVVTATGPEHVRLFTGQMVDAPLVGRQAALQGISANRLKLSALVHPPAVAGRYEGSRADWVVSYALASCGVYLSPPPQPGCRLWMPMHGSIHPFIPDTNGDAVGGVYWNGGVGNDNSEWTGGPFHLAADFIWQPEADGGNRDYTQNGTHATPLDDGDDMASQAGLRGKMEMWIYGYPYDFNDFPSASGGVATWARLQQTNVNDTSIDIGIRATNTSSDRKPYIVLTYDDVGSFTSFTGATPIPKDGQWHFLGLAYDFTGANHKRWINVDGIVETSNTSIPTSGYPATADYATGHPKFTCRWPVAEVQVTAGAHANPDDHPWLLDIPFTPGARMTPSLINLVNVAETEPREAWELIGSYAQADLAMLRVDENDIVEYLGPAHWVRESQQTVTDGIDTSRNARPVPVVQDPTKIRNAVRVSYDLSQSSTRHTIVGTFSSELALSPGITVFLLPLTTAAVELRSLTIALNDGTGPQPTNTTYITLNASFDGTGAYATAAQATATIISWHPGAVTVEIVNRTTGPLYIANDNDWPALAIAGKPHYTLSTFAEDRDTASIADRGERSLPVTSTGVQRAEDARRLARDLKAVLMRPVITVGNSGQGIELSGDPRRRPGALVSVRDDEAGIDDSLWRLQTVEHNGMGARYRNTVTVRRTLPILVVGEGVIGRTLVGPNSRTVEPESGL